MPIPVSLRIKNLEERLDILESKQRWALDKGLDVEWEFLERDRRQTLAELGAKRGEVVRADNLAHDAPAIARIATQRSGRRRAFGVRSSHPLEPPFTLGRRVGG